MRAGCVSPGVLPTGMVPLETTGAKSGLPRRVTLLGTVLEGCLFVGTACGDRSQWLRNLRAEPRPLLARRPRASRRCPRLRRRRSRPATQMLPPLARAVAAGLLPAATAWGWQFAVIRRPGVVRPRGPHQALRFTSQQRVDLLIPDVAMPLRRGTELAHRLQALEPSAKVLLMSAHVKNPLAVAGVATLTSCTSILWP
jgi:CheY-like chemotaxis protein